MYYNDIAYIYDQLGWDRASIKLWERIKKYIFNGQYQPKTLLDIACGTGSLCTQVYKQGIVSEGIDLSIPMISVAKQKALENELDISFHIEDMCDFDLGKKYDIITCLNNSINHILSLDDWKLTFKNVRSHLRNGGLFIFDITTIKAFHDTFNSFHMEKNNKGDYIIQKSSFLEEEMIATRIMNIFLSTEKKGRYKGVEEVFRQKSFESSQIIESLREVGFLNYKIFNYSFEELKYPDEENNNIYVCR